MKPLIDTHVHLGWESFDEDRDEVLHRASDAGVVALIDLGTDLASSRRAREHAHRYDSVWFAAGIHPNDAGRAKQDELAGIEELLADERCVALGEIGLDFYRDHAEPSLQEHWLREQLALAERVGKPVVLHDRKASRELIRVLDEAGYDGIDGPGGVFHCFAGDMEMAREVVERGFHISFTGNISFKNSDRPLVAATVPLERLMVETDSPFLAPVPRRGRRNEPAYVPYVAAALAQALGLELDEVAEATTANALRLFDLPTSLGEDR